MFCSGTTWGLQILADNNIEANRLESSLIAFAGSVFCKKPDAILGSGDQIRPTFTFMSHPMLREFVQKTARRYRLKVHRRYVFEVARYDAFHVRDRTLLRTTWGASLYNESWDQMFAENGKLAIGAAATWNPSYEAFFPCNHHSASTGLDGGFKDFLTGIHSVLNFLNKEKYG